MIPFKPQELDIFFTSGRNLWGCLLNRASGAGLKNAFNYDIPTHTGFMTIDHGQWFATELTEDGIEEDSFKKYLTTKRFKARLHSVYRWDTFATPKVRTSVLEHLVALRQADKGYDWVGAILCNKAVRLLFPKLRSCKQRQFCSENVFETLRLKGWKGWPIKWGAHAPHPYTLYKHISADKTFSLVWKAPHAKG